MRHYKFYNSLFAASKACEIIYHIVEQVIFSLLIFNFNDKLISLYIISYKPPF